ncbi:uncharacterized protein MELLADRAFT_56941 [Melampsora larici-populina 98AG31]|uniref:Amidohydrolase-related domain-containing protein n=1 Tax=Melampsora larici-populina (strain 98AG31 / pathotype 3-4-7) TaxID=747676 RepID=F4RWF4_MELLP|nr:uncharacterized protein MELLADRAFT_56941 [Melampsora larici-populina 98AG31]EGG03332.1 hypothetical protein MELLADRAFT_56941 [Melampsora larici-populina 98AG31]
MPKKTPPSLPISAFSPITPPNLSISSIPNKRNKPIFIIDSHVKHQENEDHQEFKKDWSDSILTLRKSFIEFQSNSPEVESIGPLSQSTSSLNLKKSQSVSPFLGFIFVHDQTSTLDQDKKLKAFDLGSIEISPALGEIIWAPLNEGSEVLIEYLNEIQDVMKSNPTRRLLGCSYSIQSTNHSDRTSLTNPKLIESLKTLGEKGLSVEFLVEGNLDRSAPSVLEEILECVSAVRNDQELGKETKFSICEMGKPHMVTSHSVVPSSASYSSILSHLFSLSLFSNLSIKLSGLPLLIDLELAKGASTYYDRCRRPYHASGYTAAPKPYTSTEEVNEIKDDVVDHHSNNGKEESDLAWKEIKKRMKFYLEPILEAFGDHRIMYSSDFPGFGSLFDDNEEKEEKINSRLKSNYYECQFELFRECLSELGLEGEALDNVFGLNAQKWYGL